MSYFRLRQICLVSPDLERAIADIEAIFGVTLCHRDPAVGKYGLANALFPFGATFLEIVSPTREGTAAGRFLERSGGVGGYMAIFNCDDVERRRDHATALGITIAHDMEYAAFAGTQLHPRDCRAAMIEFDCTKGGESPDGPYWPAGPHWQDCVRTERVTRIAAIEIETPAPDELGAHWAGIIEQPLQGRRIATDMIDIDFVQGTSARETLRTIRIDAADPAAVRQAATERGYVGKDGSFDLCGVRFSVQS